MTFGLRALALSAAVLGQKCPTGKALCDCISSFDGVVLESATMKLLDLPADCAFQWVKRQGSKSIAEVEAANPTLQLVTGGNTGADNANQVCRVKFSVDSSPRYHNPVTNLQHEPEYHHNSDGDTHTDNMYIGRVYGEDSYCHFGTWSVTAESDGEEWYAPTYELLMIPSSCTPSWKDPDQVTGTIPTNDEKASGAIAFCERSAVCAVKDTNDVWHPGYAVGSHRTHACTAFCQDGDCDGVCAGCNGCQTAGAPMGEGVAEGGCSGETATTAAPADGDALSQSEVQDSSAFAASVCLLAGLLA